MKTILTIAFIAIINLTAFSQDTLKSEIEKKSQDLAYSYAYIEVQGKLFSKKLVVNVDLGETPEQLKTGKEYSEILTNKKSYAAILNYMTEKQFELVNTLDYSSTYQGSGGSYGIVFIMKKKN